MGITELLIILLIVVVLFGAKKLPEIGRGVGQGIKEFKSANKDEPQLPTIDAVKVKDIRVDSKDKA